MYLKYFSSTSWSSRHHDVCWETQADSSLGRHLWAPGNSVGLGLGQRSDMGVEDAAATGTSATFPERMITWTRDMKERNVEEETGWALNLTASHLN